MGAFALVPDAKLRFRDLTGAASEANTAHARLFAQAAGDAPS